MDNLMQIITVPVISAIVYAAMQLYKYIVNGKEKWVRLIPVIAVLLGVVLGIAAFYAVNEIMPAENVFTASHRRSEWARRYRHEPNIQAANQRQGGRRQ